MSGEVRLVSKLSLHLQGVPGWAGSVLEGWNAGWVKLVNIGPGGDPFPGRRKCIRFFTDDWDRALIDRGAAGAQDYMAQMLPKWRQYGNWGGCAFELPNEPDVNSDRGIANLVAFSQRCIEMAHANGVTVVAGNFAEGNPSGEPDEVRRKMTALAPMLRQADYWGLHAYWCPPVAGPADQWHATRYRTLAEIVRQVNGSVPPILIGECGIDGGIRGLARTGWRRLSDRSAYTNDLAAFEGEIQKDGLVQAAFVFTALSTPDWATFEVDEALARALVGRLPAAQAPQVESKPAPRPTGGTTMQIDGRCMSVEEFRQFVAGLTLGPVTMVVIHHTASPDEQKWAQYGGGQYWLPRMKAYYETLKWTDAQGQVHIGWNAGPHLYIDDAGIWLFTPLTQDGVGVTGHNVGTRHIEIVGNYTDHVPAGKTLDNAVAAAAIVLRGAGLTAANLAMHRDLESSTSCPGDALAARWGWLKDLIKRALQPAYLPESEPATDAPTLASKCRWWVEEMQREREAGNTARAEEIGLSLIRLTYRLEAALRT